MTANPFVEMAVVMAVSFGIFCVLYVLTNLYCRLTAQKCPNCGSRWQTELVSEWDGEEDWQCHHCLHYWGVPDVSDR